jgi:hypothetical protein
MHATEQIPEGRAAVIYSDSLTTLEGIHKFISQPWQYHFSPKYGMFLRTIQTILDRNLTLTIQKVKAHLDDNETTHINPMHTAADELAKAGLEQAVTTEVQQLFDQTAHSHYPPLLTLHAAGHIGWNKEMENGPLSSLAFTGANRVSPGLSEIAYHSTERTLEAHEQAGWMSAQTAKYPSNGSGMAQRRAVAATINRKMWNHMARFQAPAEMAWMWDRLRTLSLRLYCKAADPGTCPLCPRDRSNGRHAQQNASDPRGGAEGMDSDSGSDHEGDGEAHRSKNPMLSATHAPAHMQ